MFAPDVVQLGDALQRVEAVSGHTLITKGYDDIFTLVRSTSAGDAIHLVNLIGVDNARWRDAAATPLVQRQVRLRYAVGDSSAVRAVVWATPDDSSGTFQPLEVVRGRIEFVVPRLAYWDMVLVQYN